MLINKPKTNMTIDSSWIACFKEEVPEAFVPRPPFAPTAVFCDGQIRLMPSAIEGVVSWEEYIQRQFERHIKRYFERGVSCVILAFDDYTHVPAAKSMTQVRLYVFVVKFSTMPICELQPWRTVCLSASGGRADSLRFCNLPRLK
jgi:hypothetical protein